MREEYSQDIKNGLFETQEDIRNIVLIIEHLVKEIDAINAYLRKEQ